MLRCACLPRAPAASMRRTQPVLCCGLGLGATELRRVRPGRYDALQLHTDGTARSERKGQLSRLHAASAQARAPNPPADLGCSSCDNGWPLAVSHATWLRDNGWPRGAACDDAPHVPRQKRPFFCLFVCLLGVRPLPSAAQGRQSGFSRKWAARACGASRAIHDTARRVACDGRSRAMRRWRRLRIERLRPISVRESRAMHLCA